jgi:hypothetical protein
MNALGRWLGELGLAIKAGTGSVAVLRNSGAKVRWLGVELAMKDGALVPCVPEETTTAKAAALRAEWTEGLLSENGLIDRLRQLNGYYDQLVHEDEARRAVATIRDRVLRQRDEEDDRSGIGREGRHA